MYSRFVALQHTFIAALGHTFSDYIRSGQIRLSYKIKEANHSIFQVLAGINAYALYKALTKDNISRRDFIFKLAEKLVGTFIDSRTVVTAEQSLSVGGPRRRWQVRMVCKEGMSAHVCQT